MVYQSLDKQRLIDDILQSMRVRSMYSGKAKITRIWEDLEAKGWLISLKTLHKMLEELEKEGRVRAASDPDPWGMVWWWAIVTSEEA